MEHDLFNGEWKFTQFPPEILRSGAKPSPIQSHRNIHESKPRSPKHPKTKYNQHPTQRIYFQNRWKVDASTKIIAKHSNWLFGLGKAAFLGAMKVDEPAESKGEFSLPLHGFIPLRSGTPQYLAPEVASTLARYDEHLGYERFFGPKNSVGEWRDLEAEIHYFVWVCTCSKHRYFVFERWFFTEEWVGGIAWLDDFLCFFNSRPKGFCDLDFLISFATTVGSLSRIIVFKIKLLVELDSWSQILPGKVWGKNKSYMALNQPEIQKVIMFCFTSEIWGELISGVWVWCFMILGWQRGGIVGDTERSGSFRNISDFWPKRLQVVDAVFAWKCFWFVGNLFPFSIDLSMTDSI